MLIVYPWPSNELNRAQSKLVNWVDCGNQKKHGFINWTKILFFVCSAIAPVQNVLKTWKPWWCNTEEPYAVGMIRKPIKKFFFKVFWYLTSDFIYFLSIVHTLLHCCIHTLIVASSIYSIFFLSKEYRRICVWKHVLCI